MDSSNILYSVVGGFVVLFLRWFWNDIIPRILQRFYHHEPSIDGKWRTTFSEGEVEYHETITVKQKGRKVKGEIALREGDEDTIYKLEGTFKYLILTGTYESTNPTEYEQGAFALRYIKGNFRGQYVLLSKESEELISSEYEWVRN